MEGSLQGHEDTFDVSHQRTFFNDLSYFVGWISRTSMESYALKLTMGFKNVVLVSLLIQSDQTSQYQPLSHREHW